MPGTVKAESDDASTNQGPAKLASNYQKLGRDTD